MRCWTEMQGPLDYQKTLDGFEETAEKYCGPTYFETFCFALYLVQCIPGCTEGQRNLLLAKARLYWLDHHRFFDDKVHIKAPRAGVLSS